MATPLTAPSIFTGPDLAGTNIIGLYWNWPTNATQLEIERDGSTVYVGPSTGAFTISGYSASYNDTGLTQDTEYSYRARGIGVNGETGPWSNPKVFGTATTDSGSVLQGIEYDKAADRLTVGALTSPYFTFYDTNPDGSINKLGQGGSGYWVAGDWSDDGQFLASGMLANPYLYVYHWDGSTLTRLSSVATDSRVPIAPATSNNYSYIKFAGNTDYFVAFQAGHSSSINKGQRWLRLERNGASSAVTVCSIPNPVVTAITGVEMDVKRLDVSDDGQYVVEAFAGDTTNPYLVVSSVSFSGNTVTYTQLSRPSVVSGGVSGGNAMANGVPNMPAYTPQALSISPNNEYVIALTNGTIVPYYNDGSSITKMTYLSPSQPIAKIKWTSDSKYWMGMTRSGTSSRVLFSVYERQGSGPSATFTKVYTGPSASATTSIMMDEEDWDYHNIYYIKSPEKTHVGRISTLGITRTEDTTAPQVPVLTGQVLDTTLSVVTWEDGYTESDVDGFEVYRDDVFVNTNTSNDMSWVEFYDTTQESHTFKVRAFDAAGNYSAFSNEVTLPDAPPPDTTAPDAPTLSGNTSATNNQLTWSTVSDAAQYQVFRDGQLIATQAGTSYTDTLTTTTSHIYTVKAVDAASNVSASSNSVTLQYIPPDTTAPTVATLSGNNVNASSNSLTWTSAVDAVNFRIYRDGQLIATQSTKSYTDNVDATVSHSYTVTSADAAGNWSGNSNTVTLQYIDTLPPVSALLSGQNTNAGSNSLWWTGASDAVNYRIYRDGQLIATQSGTSYTDTIDATVSHSYTVRSSDAAGNWSTDSNTVSLQYVDVTPPNPPVLSGENMGATSNSLSWTSVSDAVSYDVFRDGQVLSGPSGISNPELRTAQSGTTYIDTVDATVSHTYTVKAKDAADNVSATSNSVTLQYVPPPPPDTTPPGAATLTGTNVHSMQNSLTWAAVTDATSYAVYRDGVYLTTVTGTSYLDNTDASISHTYTVRAGDDARNWAGASNAVTLQYTTIPDPIISILLEWTIVGPQLGRDGEGSTLGREPLSDVRRLGTE